MKSLRLILLTVILTFSLSCAGKQADTPVLPVDTDLSVQNKQIADNNRIIWGLYNVRISEDLGNVEITPMRTAGMHFNTVRLLEVTACTDCITIGNFQVFNPGEIALDVTLKHPFPTLLAFTGFDVRGILIAGEDYTFPLSGRSIPYGDQKPTILNADGYTHLFNPTEFPESSPNPPILEYIPGNKASGGDLSATLNPYIAYCEDKERRMFNTGGIYTRTLRLRVPGSGGLEFGYAVDACWHPAGGPVTNPVEDFPPEANCNEAYKIDLEYGSGIVPGGGSAVVHVDVYDHQGQDTIESVTIEAPLLFDGETPLSFSTVKSEECFQYVGVIENNLGSYEDEIPVLVRVTDTVLDQNLGQVDAWTVAFLDTTPKEGWAVTWISDGEGYVKAFDNVCDAYGNIYVTGSIRFESADLDPGSGEDIHGIYDASSYLSKFDSDGQYLWGRSWGGAAGGTDFQRIDCDSKGNVYISGIFGGEIDFDPGPDEDIHISTHVVDSFLCKYNSSGEYLWTRIWPSQEWIRIYSIEIDTFDNIYVCGTFYGSTDFDPGPGEAIIETDEDHSFICKLDSGGYFQWAGSWGCTYANNDSALRDMDTDEEGNVYCTGFFNGLETDFDPGPGEYLLDAPWYYSYLSVFDTDGNHQWAVSWNSSNGCTLAVDPLGFIYVGGGFQGKVDFDPGPGVEERDTIDMQCNAYLSVFTLDGKFLGVGTWDTQLDGLLPPYGSSGELIYDIIPDGLGNLYVGTIFIDLFDIDPGPGQDLRYSVGSRDAALMKIHLSGELVWARTWGGARGEWIYALDLDENGNIYGAGAFMEEVDFDPGPGTDYHESPIYNSIGAYLIKFPPSGNW